jgi:hypothetical protein
MKQTTFADSGFEIATKKIHKRIFLEDRNALVPWALLVRLIQGYAPVAKSGRPQFPLKRCCVFISCSLRSIIPFRRWKRRRVKKERIFKCNGTFR